MLVWTFEGPVNSCLNFTHHKPNPSDIKVTNYARCNAAHRSTHYILTSSINLFLN
jgi:hypothetical protein